MKKVLILICVSVILLSGCSKAAPDSAEEITVKQESTTSVLNRELENDINPVKKESVYIGFDGIEQIDWTDTNVAFENGWIIVENGTITQHRGRLLSFYETSQEGQPGMIRILSVYPGAAGEKQYSLRDVFYDGKGYYHAWFWENEVYWNNQCYTQFHILEGNNRTSYVLSNHADLTYEELVENAFLRPIDHVTLAVESYGKSNSMVEQIEWLDEEGKYRGFQNISAMGYSPEKSHIDGAYCVYYMPDAIKSDYESYGEENLQKFLESVACGEPTRLRFVEFKRVEMFPARYEADIKDLLYDGSNYYYASMVDDSVVQYTYFYCMKREIIQLGSMDPEKYKCYILCNEANLSQEDWLSYSDLKWEEIMRVLIPPTEIEKAQEMVKWWNREKQCYECPQLLSGGDSVQEKRQWNLPESVLEDISTENLMDIVAAYPYISEINMYTDLEQGIAEMAKQFNALEELVYRCGFEDKVSKAYNDGKGMVRYNQDLLLVWKAVLGASERINAETGFLNYSYKE